MQDVVKELESESLLMTVRVTSQGPVLE